MHELPSFRVPLAARPVRTALVAVVAILGAVGCGSVDGTEAAPSAGDRSGTTVVEPIEDRSAEWEAACGDAPEDTACGVTDEQRHDLNMRYADRYPFEGDPAEAQAVADAVREALTALASRSPSPTETEVREALADHEDVQTSPNPVSAQGTGFGLWVAGGCVFGSVSEGDVTVEISGPIHDGGCLASYGH